jgi:hypothetical protein
MAPVSKIGIFPCTGKLAGKTTDMLQSYRHFTFPIHHFNGVNTAGRIQAIAIDSLKKPASFIIFATGRIDGNVVKFAIAAPFADEPVKEMIISEFNGQINLAARVTLEQILLIVRTTPTPKPVSREELDIQPVGFPFSIPDFSYHPTDPPFRKWGKFSGLEASFFEYLKTEIEGTWLPNNYAINGADPGEIIPLAAESLIRSNKARLNRLVAWGMLLPFDANCIFSRSREISSLRLTLMLMRFTEEYVNSGNFPPKQILAAVKNMIPHSFIKYLTEKFKNQRVSKADAWRFAVNNPKDPEVALIKALKTADGLAEKYKDRGVSKTDAWRFAVYYPSNPEEALTKTLKTADGLAEKFKDQRVSKADAWHFAVHNPSNPEEALTKALNTADGLAEKFKDQRVSKADAWHFAVNNPSNPEEALKNSKGI